MRPFGALRATALLLCATSLLLPGTANAESCISGTITAERTNDSGFQGLWKYCVEVSWQLDRYDLSHLDLILALENCECVCDPRLVRFGSPAGQSNGVNGSGACTVDYVGAYLCMGDKKIPNGMNAPAVKFDVAAGSTCEPGLRGTGRYCFYSPMPPAPTTVHPNAVAIKHGQEFCFGNLQGTIPTCNCALPVHERTWGTIKAIYR